MNLSYQEKAVINDSGIGHDTISPVVIRQSSFLLLGKLLIIEILFTISLLLLQTVFSPLVSSFIFFGIAYSTINSFLILLLLAIKIYIIYSIASNWAFEFYCVKKGEVIHYQRGPFNHQEERFPLSSFIEVKINQGIIGRILHYGSIDLYNPFLKKSFYFFSINNPHIYVEVIESALPNDKKLGEVGKPVYYENIWDGVENEQDIFQYQQA